MTVHLSGSANSNLPRAYPTSLLVLILTISDWLGVPVVQILEEFENLRFLGPNQVLGFDIVIRSLSDTMPVLQHLHEVGCKRTSCW